MTDPLAPITCTVQTQAAINRCRTMSVDLQEYLEEQKQYAERLTASGKIIPLDVRDRINNTRQCMTEIRDLGAEIELLKNEAYGGYMPSLTWVFLRCLWPTMHQYAVVLENAGYETPFALGLLRNVRDYEALGVWKDDAEFLVAWGPDLQVEVKRRTNEITRDIGITTERWLETLPVPLPQYAPALKAQGFTSEYFLLQIQVEDLEMLGVMPEGHIRVIMHVVLHLRTATSEQQALPVTTDVRMWLEGVHSTLATYTSTFLLYGIKTTYDLCRVSEKQFIEMDVRLAHRRLLISFITRVRAYYASL